MTTLLRTILGGTSLCCALMAATPAAATDATPDGIRLQPLQAHIYKTPDPGNERTESWIFWLLVETTAARELTITGAEIALLADGRPVRTTVYDAGGVAPLVIVPPMAPKRLDGSEPAAPVFWPQGIRIRTTETQAAHVDAMRVTLTIAEGDRSLRAGVELPVETYTQKTALLFSFPWQSHRHQRGRDQRRASQSQRAVRARQRRAR